MRFCPQLGATQKVRTLKIGILAPFLLYAFCIEKNGNFYIGCTLLVTSPAPTVRTYYLDAPYISILTKYIFRSFSFKFGYTMRTRRIPDTLAYTGHLGVYRTPRRIPDTSAYTGHVGVYRTRRRIPDTSAYTGHVAYTGHRVYRTRCRFYCTLNIFTCIKINAQFRGAGTRH